MNYTDFTLDECQLKQVIHRSQSVFKKQFASVITECIQYLRASPDFWDEHYLAFQFSELCRLDLEDLEVLITNQNKEIHQLLTLTNGNLESTENSKLLKRFFHADMCALAAIKLSIDMLDDHSNDVEMILLANQLQNSILLYELAFNTLFAGEDKVFKRGKGAKHGTKKLEQSTQNNPVFSLSKEIAKHIWSIDGSVNSNQLSSNIIDAYKRIYADFHETQSDDFYHLGLLEIHDISTIEDSNTDHDKTQEKLHYRYHYLQHPNSKLAHKICVPMKLPAVSTLYYHIKKYHEQLNVNVNKTLKSLKADNDLIAKIDEFLLNKANTARKK